MADSEEKNGHVVDEEQDNEEEVAAEGDASEEEEDALETGDQPRTPINPEELRTQFQTAKQLAGLGQFEEAVDLLREVCEDTNAFYGDTSAELAECCYHLGRALFNMFKDKLKQSVTTFIKKRVKEMNRDPTDALDVFASDSDEEGPATGPNLDAQSDIIDEAWECLETSRIIYEKVSGKELELSDVLMALGEIEAEATEQVDDAVGDYKKALDIRTKLVHPEKERLIAEVHCQIATLFHTVGQPQAAIEYYANAIHHLETRLKELPGGATVAPAAPLPDFLAGAKSEKEELPVVGSDAEDLVGLIQELKEKLEESKLLASQTPAGAKPGDPFASANFQFNFGFAPAPEVSAAAPQHSAEIKVNNLGTFGRRKAAPSDAPAASSAAVSGSASERKRKANEIDGPASAEK